MTPQLLPEGTITTPGGFRATGIHAGLKTTRDRDLGLLIAKSACSAAAHFGAGSKIAGAWTTANLRRGAEDIRAVLVLSGADGGRGAAAVEACNELAALLADEAGLTAQNVAMIANGATEQPFDLPALRRGVPRALDELDSRGGQRLALALAMPGETPRQAAISATVGAGEVLLGGLAINAAPPRYIITTNAALSGKLLKSALDAVLAEHPALDQAAILLLANGLSGVPAPKRASDAAFKAWRAALAALVGHLIAEPGA